MVYETFTPVSDAQPEVVPDDEACLPRWGLPLPRVVEITANPEAMAELQHAPMFISTPLPDEYGNVMLTLVATDEAEVLRDFEGRLRPIAERQGSYAEGIASLHPEAPIEAYDFLESMHFLSGKNVRFGVETIARHWANLLRSGQKQELFFTVYEEDSSAYIAGLVFETMRAACEQELMSRVHPFFPKQHNGKVLDERLMNAVQREGLMVVDDWTATGLQAKLRMRELQKLGIDKMAIEFNFLCVPTYVEEFIRGVRARAVFLFSAERGDVAVASVFCAPASAFRTRENALNIWLNLSEPVSLKLRTMLYNIICPYKEKVGPERVLNPEKVAAFLADCIRHRAVLDELLSLEYRRNAQAAHP
jgi:hypothetical protein